MRPAPEPGTLICGGSPRTARTAAASWGKAVMIPTVGAGAPSRLIVPSLMEALMLRALTVLPVPMAAPTMLPLTLIIDPPDGGGGPGEDCGRDRGGRTVSGPTSGRGVAGWPVRWRYSASNPGSVRSNVVIR